EVRPGCEPARRIFLPHHSWLRRTICEYVYSNHRTVFRCGGAVHCGAATTHRRVAIEILAARIAGSYSGVRNIAPVEKRQLRPAQWNVPATRSFPVIYSGLRCEFRLPVLRFLSQFGSLLRAK